MSQPDPRSDAPPVLLILWTAMLTSHAIMLGVALFVREQSQTQPPDTLNVMVIALTGCGVAAALASSLGVNSFAAEQPPMTIAVLRYALAESCTVFGFVLSTLGADLLYLYMLVGLGVLAHLLAFPSKRSQG